MLTKSRYSNFEMMMWTRYGTLKFLVYASVLTVAYHLLGFTFLRIPWAPLAVIGTAVAFIVGFRNNASYGRIWEARKIWGGIVNSSRTWAMKTIDMVSNEYADEKISPTELSAIKQRLIYRHIAWMTALRYAMRQPKPWEIFENDRANNEWSKKINIPEKTTKLEDELAKLLSKEELTHVLQKTNKSTAILSQQSQDIAQLKERKLIWEFSFLELENVLAEFFTLQGQSERIKNFPYPRQFASISSIFIGIFIILLPFAVLPEFHKFGLAVAVDFPFIGKHFIWLSVPFCAAISWVFHTMERIGKVGENPFEGTANDVPISTIARGIEIDLREMLNENQKNIPPPLEQTLNVQM